MRDFDDFDDIFRRIQRMLDEDFTGGYSYSNKRYGDKNENVRDYDKDIFQDENHIYITTELRVRDEDLSVTPKEDCIIIESVLDGSWKKKPIMLPSKINPKTAKITFNNYVLDIELEKIKEDKNDQPRGNNSITQG